MKTLYFDCFAGASGDMILGAMVAAGVDPEFLKQQLSLLQVEGFEIEFAEVERAGISATHARVRTRHEHAHRHLGDILEIIYKSGLSDKVKGLAAKVFARLADAEARVHNQPVGQVHFHEVGALDAIVDVVGAAVAFDVLGIERFVCSPLHVGSGTVEMDHGRFPIPPPAVSELLKGAPIYASDIKGELVTPTGAAIIVSVCDEFGPLPLLKIQHTGYGAGTRVYEKFPNVLRVLIGEDEAATVSFASGGEQLWMVETNLDDLSPQILGYVMDQALDMGALDCYFTPVHMKKNRPGTLVSVLCRDADQAKLSEMLFRETTTLGLRRYRVERPALERELVSVGTRYGPIDVKVARINGRIVNQMPEYEQCCAAARQANVALRLVEDDVKLALALSQLDVSE